MRAWKTSTAVQKITVNYKTMKKSVGSAMSVHPARASAHTSRPEDPTESRQVRREQLADIFLQLVVVVVWVVDWGCRVVGRSGWVLGSMSTCRFDLRQSTGGGERDVASIVV